MSTKLCTCTSQHPNHWLVDYYHLFLDLESFKNCNGFVLHAIKFKDLNNNQITNANCIELSKSSSGANRNAKPSTRQTSLPFRSYLSFIILTKFSSHIGSIEINWDYTLFDINVCRLGKETWSRVNFVSHKKCPFPHIMIDLFAELAPTHSLTWHYQHCSLNTKSVHHPPFIIITLSHSSLFDLQRRAKLSYMIYRSRMLVWDLHNWYIQHKIGTKFRYTKNVL